MLLENINSPADVKQLSPDQLPALCAEIRAYMIDCCSTNPGHLGASLGTVELCVALHYVYDSPHDKLIWDVGHQAYAHKILTGRREAFRDNRKQGGISGFPKREEAPTMHLVRGTLPRPYLPHWAWRSLPRNKAVRNALLP